MLGKIFIQNLKIQAKVGHEVHERHTTQNIVVNVAVWADITKSVTSSDLRDTVDYVVIQKAICDLAVKNEYVLIETLADDILTICMQDPHAVKAWVKIEKPHKFPESESVGLEVERTR